MTEKQKQDLAALSLSQVATLLAQGETSSSEITGMMLERIEADESNAYITICDKAMQDAAEADGRRRDGKALSAVDGVPMALMDNLSVKGMKMTCASRMLEGFTPPFSGTAPLRLESAGAILLGKLNMDEFAAGNTGGASLYGRVKNPRDPARTAGGASGGAAAAVAGDVAYFAVGSDGGGSARLPAAFCGVIGLKPTYGRISRYGLAALASSMDQAALLNKTAEDCAIVLALLAGQDPLDPTSLPDPPQDYRGGLAGADGLKGLRIGVPGEYAGPEIREDIRESMDALASALREAGAIVEACSLPHTKYALSAYYVIASAEFNSNMNRYDGVKFGYRARDYENYDDMLMKTRGEAFGDEVKRRILFGLYALTGDRYDAYYLKGTKARSLIAADFQQAFSRYDLLLTPSAPVTAWPLDRAFMDPAEGYGMDFCTAAASLAGLPAISIPWGEDKEGLPIGAQFTGPTLSEGTILRAAHGIEELRGRRSRDV